VTAFDIHVFGLNFIYRIIP